MELVEQQFGTGYVYKEPEKTDRVFSASTPDFDWQKGFDIEDELKKKLGSSFRLPINNQYQTQSCVGQAWAKYAGIKKVMGDPNPNWVEFSPRDIYSHIHLPGGGSYVIQGGLFMKNNGILPFEQLPSYWSGKPNVPATEELMRDRGLEGGKESGDNANPHIYDNMRQLVKGGSVEYVNEDIDSIAKAIRDNYGCVLGLYGENNGTWLTEYPKPGRIVWGHGEYAGKAKYINGKKYIGMPNSWGTGVGRGGWQWFGEEWFNPWYIGSAHTWSPEVGNIVRIADLEKIYNYVKDDYFNKPVGSKPYDDPENWNIILKVNGVSGLSSSDFNTYCTLRGLL